MAIATEDLPDSRIEDFAAEYFVRPEQYEQAEALLRQYRSKAIILRAEQIREIRAIRRRVRELRRTLPPLRSYDSRGANELNAATAEMERLLSPLRTALQREFAAELLKLLSPEQARFAALVPRQFFQTAAMLERYLVCKNGALPTVRLAMNEPVDPGDLPRIILEVSIRQLALAMRLSDSQERMLREQYEMRWNAIVIRHSHRIQDGVEPILEFIRAKGRVPADRAAALASIIAPITTDVNAMYDAINELVLAKMEPNQKPAMADWIAVSKRISYTFSNERIAYWRSGRYSVNDINWDGKAVIP